MTKEKDLFSIAQRAILYDRSSKKFLLMKYRQDLTWSLPGGRVKNSESPLEALKREISEELGEIDYEVIKTIDTHSSNDTFRIGYLVFYKSGEIMLSDEHEEFAWLTKEEIEKKDERSFHAGVKQFITSATQTIISEEYLSDLKRLQADFENYKKRQTEQQKELAGYLTEKLILDIIPVMDNFRMATEHVPEEAKESPWVTGIQYIEKQLEKVLSENGVTALEVKVGDPFDPSIMEAISSEAKEAENEGEAKKQVVAKVIQNGFKIGERIIRAAKVTVS